MSTRIGAVAREPTCRLLAQGLSVILLLVVVLTTHAATPHLAYGDSSACLLRQDGSVTCWGYGDNGQTSAPAGPFEQISMGTWSGCGLRPSGQVECWGAQSMGFPVGGLLDVPPGTYTQVDAGGYFHCAIRDDQKVVCWETQIGGEWIPYPGVDDHFVRVSTGSAAFCAIRTNGELACNGFSPPTPPAGSYIDVFAGGDTYCALRSDHQLECWGYDGYGQTLPPPGQFVTAGMGAYHACGIRVDGTLSCWGYFGNQDYRQYFPPAGQYSSLGVGTASNCALRIDGVIKCWGIDQAGEAPRLRIDPKVIEAAQVGVPYSMQLSMVDKGTIWTYQPYQPFDPLFSTSSGQLPPNFSLSGTGLLEGTAAAPGEWMVTLLGQDARGFEVQRDVAFTVVNPGQDTTPPVITPHLTGLNEQGDWYRSDVTVEWQVEDPESGATTQVGCQTILVDADTPITGAAFECAARSVGGVAYETVELRRDATLPTVNITSVQPQADPGNFFAYFTVSDALSAIAFTECAIDDTQAFAFCQGVPDTPAWSSHRFMLPDSNEHTLYVRAADNAGNYSSPVMLVVNGAPQDTTPPVIAPLVSGSPGSNGWYTSNVDISWSVVDNESPVTSATGCGDSTVSTDTAGVAFTCEATSAGGTALQSVTIKRDTQPPDTTLTGMPPNPAPFGEVAFTFTGSDSVAGVGGFECSIDSATFVACTTPRVISGLGVGLHTFTVRARDNAGIVDPSPASYAWTIQAPGDVLPPVGNPTTTKAPNAAGWFRQAATVNWNWSDIGSGIDVRNCTTKTVTSGQGVLNLTATCADLSGNIGTATLTVRVDTTPPDIGPLLNGNLYLRDATPLIAQVTDAHSGVASSSCDRPDTSKPTRSGVVTCTATDTAGNTASTKRAFYVWYRWGGYTDATFAPYPAVNLLTRGTTVPMRFRLLDANYAPVIGIRSLDHALWFFGAPCDGDTQQVTETVASTKLVDRGDGYYEMGLAVTKGMLLGNCWGLLPNYVNLEPGQLPPLMFAQ